MTQSKDWVFLCFNNGLILQFINARSENAITINAQEAVELPCTYPIATTVTGVRIPASRNTHLTISTKAPLVTGCTLGIKNTKTNGTSTFEAGFIFYIGW